MSSEGFTRLNFNSPPKRRLAKANDIGPGALIGPLLNHSHYARGMSFAVPGDVSSLMDRAQEQRSGPKVDDRLVGQHKIAPQVTA